jgi:polar amino acid transport system substrate-binding protein
MKIFILTLFLFSSGSALSKETLRVAFGDTLPPWVLKEKNRGIIYDILVTCLSDEEIQIVPMYVPYSRRLKSYKNNKVDAVIDINEKVITENKLEGFNSNIAYSYINYAISLEGKGYQFKTMNDLLGVSLLSWQDAIIHLGGDYAEMAKKHKRYSETHDQGGQVKMLFSKRVDVIQMDLQIFKYYRGLKKKNQKIDYDQKVVLNKLFGESPNSIFFRSKRIREIFNKNLKKVKEDGTYDKILSKYGRQ